MTESLRAKLNVVIATKKDGCSLYAIAKATGMKWDTLKRFAMGKNLRGDELDKLAAHLGMELVDRKRR